jgi:PKD repeat protein
MQIAVTPANANYVYALISTNTNPSILYGVYRSINGGTAFSLMYNSSNLLSADCYTPTPATGQGEYDLTIAASPLVANEIVIGGITAWRSVNGGTSWTNIGCGYNYNNGNPPFLHADHHELEYTPAGVLYGANDGGIFQFNGTQWTDLTTPMNIAQIYKIGLSTLSPNHWISGHQDNGSNIFTNGIYKASLAADGCDCFIDRTNNNNLFASQALGQFFYSSDAGASWNTCTVSAAGNGAFVSPWKQDPQNATTFYCGKSQIKKSTTFVPPIWNAPVGTMPGVNAAQYVTEFAISPANNQKIYAIHGTTGMFISNNAATTWTLGNSGIPVGSGALTFVTAHPTNSLIAWATMSGYSSGNKVFKTVNGGASWTNITYNLPNLPANCSVFEMNSTSDRLYVGMDVGIYYIDNTNPTVWTLYNTGLPNVPISDMEISPASPTKIRAGTYGRGVWQADIVPSAAPPVSAFNFAGTTCSVAASFLFNDISTNAPSTWAWTVNPAAGVTINTPSSQNPTITITNFGTYTVALVASNGFGPGTLYTQTLNLAPPVVNASSSASVICVGQTVTLNASGVNTYTWQPGNLTGAAVSVSPGASQIYTVTGTDLNGCDGMNSVSVTVSPCTGIISSLNNEFNYSVFPNPSYDKLNIAISVDQVTDFELEILDAKGKQVLKQTAQYTQSNTTHQINVSSLAGGVYFLKIKASDGHTQTIKLIKQ